MPRRARPAPAIDEAPDTTGASAPVLPAPDLQNPKSKIQNRPDWSFEQAAQAAGYGRIAGADEVGRGAWAGPLVAAAVVFPTPLIAAGPGGEPGSLGDGPQPCPIDPALQLCLADLAGVRDSKQLSPAARRALDACIRRHGEVGIGWVSAALCDRIGMAAANRLALTRAIRALPALPDYLLLDAFPLPGLRIPQQALIKGDARVISIAAASIVAKVARDALMHDLHVCWPAYGFGNHKGYGTAVHHTALIEQGPCPDHRRSIDPLRTQLAGEQP
jgi:ribonuclease HII